MIHQVYAVYDDKVGAFTTPFMVRSKGEAIRAFSDAANDSKTNVGAHISDFSLFRLGTFDDTSGFYEQESSGPVVIISARECVAEVSSS